MDASMMRGFEEEVVPLYDAAGREKQLPCELHPTEAVSPESEELEKWRKTHGQQAAAV